VVLLLAAALSTAGPDEELADLPEELRPAVTP
jgi:hypothetical protein